MRVLLVHNYYQQPGGEDQVFADEARLLRRHGHEVVPFTTDNDLIDALKPLSLAAKSIWNRAVHRELRHLVQREQPAIVHFHNTFPLVSPAAYHAVRLDGVAVVQTLHNYRLVCANALLLRDGRPCEQCVGWPAPIPGIVHACYRSSRVASLGVAAMLGSHQLRGTWRQQVDRYIALTDFARDVLIRHRLPPERVVVKPNFVDPDPGPGAGDGDYLLYAGRLGPEKGIETLMGAWQRLSTGGRLLIAGAGPLEEMVCSAAQRDPRIEFLGWQPGQRVRELLSRARLLVLPSLCYEGLPRTLVESFAAGTPVVASNIGSLAGLVRDGETGMLAQPGDAGDLAAVLGRLLSRPDRLSGMREQARREFELRYTAAANYRQLMDIYRQALEVRGSADSESHNRFKEED